MVKSEKWRRNGSEMSEGVKNSNQPKVQQAQWNVQVVRGKVTTRCLWNACKALSVGLLLLSIGTTMAVIGYYADQLSIRSETRGNSTVKIKNESRGFHLNNLSYAGPIVMGIGGFIVVAACVMTFEARDSAAKVVPARFKPNLNASMTGESAKTTPRTSRPFQRMESKRSASAQTPGGGRCPGIYREPSGAVSPKNDRIAFTAAFVQFSRELMENSTFESNRRWRQKLSEVNLNKSPSAPNLRAENLGSAFPNEDPESSRKMWKGSPKSGNRNQRDSVRPLDIMSSNLLLRPSYLQRQALSMDNPMDYDSCDSCTPPPKRLSRQQSRRFGGSGESFEMELGSSAGVSGSQTSMALDLHECQVTLKVRDESANKRSDTARRHQLMRQKPVEDDVITRCSYIPSMNLQSPCHRCLKATGSCGGRDQIPKMTSDVRSQSFSPTCSFDPKKCTFHESNPKVCCDHRRNIRSSKNVVKLCCEEKLWLARRHSPCVSPHKSPRTECRVQRLEGGECLVHRPRDSPGARPLVRANARKTKRGNPKLEGSLSAEEQNSGRSRRGEHARSASFSPTRNSSTPSRDGSYSPGRQSCCSMVEIEKSEMGEPS